MRKKQSLIIAEAGVNHNGSMELAYQLIDAACEAGADVVKFQTYKTEKLVTREADQANYQRINSKEFRSQYDMLKSLELSYDQFIELNKYCQIQGIEFMSTAFDHDSIDFLLDEIKQSTFKISSGDLTNAPLLLYLASKKVNIILSTGMATMEEIHIALSFIAYGLSGQKDMSRDKVESYYHTKQAKAILNEYCTVLHCTTEYPTAITNVNLNTIDYLKEKLLLPVGFSDHTEGIIFPIVAAGKNVSVIEKHFTLDKNMTGPDHKASLDPSELKEMVTNIRLIEKGLGKKEKIVSSSEYENRKVARKSIITSKAIQKGENFDDSNIDVRRPGEGISPFDYWDIIGQKASRNYRKDELIR
ncbi:N-acetylneuraminate synthase [Alkalicoccus halolimnae]|uniref:N-acetylneuraminate synthase n=1 Tax=Alkalicoccus halolimnae TaxID=1667239 RepID=A0A5C7FI74_9BACI|nr:N-acetylneuraminate synthase [Alkalicoccus halolimnae]TXF87017.1 N-acetylneuraminate synthase [Alkalicoccus halolimnae]